MSYFGTTDFKSRVMNGEVAGWSVVNAMGEFENSGTDAAGEDCCRRKDFAPDGPVRLPTPAPAGEQMTLVSESNADNGATATGVLTTRLEYVDATGAELTEDVTLDGTTPVDTVATDIRFVNDFYALTVGSNGVAEGNVAVYKKGGSIPVDLYQMIALGGNKSLVPHRMVPTGYKFLLQQWSCSEAQGKRCVFRIRSTDINGALVDGVFLFKGTCYVKNQASPALELTATVPALSIVKVTAWPDSNGAEGSCNWWAYKVAI